MGIFDLVAEVAAQNNRRRGGREVAGPYRDQSSIPSIRHQATRREHRRNPFDSVAPAPSPLQVEPLGTSFQPRVPLAVLPTADGGLPVIPELQGQAPINPQTARINAVLHGRFPPGGQRKPWPEDLVNELTEIARRKLLPEEALKDDPLAELIMTAGLTAGVGGVANLVRGGATAIVGRSAASEVVPIGQRLVTAAQALRAAPTSLRGGVESLATRAGQRAAAERTGQALAGTAVRHPFYSKAGLLAAANTAGVKGGGVEIPGALVRGTGNALLNDPLQVAETTARGLAGAVTAPAALLYSAGDSIVQGDPDPFLNTAGAMAEGTYDIGAKLLSGDDETVQKAVEDEAGLAFLPLVPAFSRTPVYGRLRSSARNRAKSVRTTLSERTPLDLRRGPEEQYIFGPLERRAERRAVAEMGQAAVRPEELRAAFHRRPIEEGARDLPTARSLRNRSGVQGGDVISTLAEYGITDPAQLALLRERVGFEGRGPGFVGPLQRPGNDVNLRAVVEHLERNPQLITDTKMRELLDSYAAGVEQLPIQKAGRGRRAAALPQAQMFGVRLPEDRVPVAARKYTDAPDRKAAWDDLSARERRAKELRYEARTSLNEATARELAGHTTAASKLRENARGHYSEARKLEADNKALRKELNPYSRPGSAVSSRARRRLWDDELLKEFEGETHAAAAAQGLKPGVYIHHGALRTEGEAATGGGRGGGKAGSVQHVRRADEFSLALTDQVDRSLAALLEGSIEGPRRGHGLRTFSRQFFSEKSVPLKVKRGGETKTVRRMTRREYSQAIRDGQISEGHYIWVPESDYKQPFTNPAVTAGDISTSAQKRLAGEIPEGSSKGSYGVAVPKEGYKEYAAQINPTKWLGEQFANTLSKSAGRVLLFSPAWVASQVIAEALPMIMARPRLILDPTYAVRLSRQIKKAGDIDKEAAMGWAAAMGEAPSRAATARELQPGYTPSHSVFYNAARAAEHTAVGRALFSTIRLRPLVLFDQWRQGKYRKVLAAAELDKELNGFFRGLQGMARNHKRVSEELKGKPLAEAIVELERNPRYRHVMDQNRRYLEDIAGNWTAFTRFERTFAPAAVFYGFIRYAFRWPFTFAKRHPLSAEINYFLSQQNAEQIEKMMGGKAPTDFFQYANPVVHGADDEQNWLPGGSRIAPGLSAPAQGILSGNVPQAAVGSLNPAYGTLVGLITGTNSFGEYDDDTGPLGLHWSLAAKQLMTLPPLARFLGVGESQSDTAKELRANDPNRKLRSFALPFLPQSGEGARANNDIISSIEQYEEEKEANGGYPPSSSSSSNPFDSVEIGGGNPFDALELE